MDTQEDKNIKGSLNKKSSEFLVGIKKSLPITLGYFPVSFTFGIMAVSSNMNPLVSTLISATNFTSAGQFAGTNLILTHSTLLEIGITTFVINIRYMLMSLAWSQKLMHFHFIQKFIVAFGITDEIFALVSLENKKLSFREVLGMIVAPYMGWLLGTLTGSFICSLLSDKVQAAMGIALYGMFLALLIPEVKKGKEILWVSLTAIGISLFLFYIPFFHFISLGWRIIIATIGASLLGATVFPRKGEENELSNSSNSHHDIGDLPD